MARGTLLFFRIVCRPGFIERFCGRVACVAGKPRQTGREEADRDQTVGHCSSGWYVYVSNLWGRADSGLLELNDTVENDSLLDQLEARREVAAITVPQLLAARELRKPLAIICLAMASQQLSGRLICICG
jgi:hypothetical protein